MTLDSEEDITACMSNIHRHALLHPVGRHITNPSSFPRQSVDMHGGQDHRLCQSFCQSPDAGRGFVLYMAWRQLDTSNHPEWAVGSSIVHVVPEPFPMNMLALFIRFDLWMAFRHLRVLHQLNMGCVALFTWFSAVAIVAAV